MSEYTAADFAAARFAEHPITEILAMRSRPNSDPDPWETSVGDETDGQMAATGWRPVREAAPLSVAALREAWEAAEVMTADNLPRKGDEVIEGQGGTSFWIFISGEDWKVRDIKYRILRRGPRRPEGAEELEGLIDRAPYPRICGVEAELADWLAERGVRVVTES